MKFTIGITTFSKRFDMVSKLVKQIRTYSKSKIIICINGEKDGIFDNDYRKNILNLCILYEDIYPIFFIEMRGLSKMWNTVINTSVDENILLLNDDIEILSNDIFDKIENYLNLNSSTILRINNSFSHFLVNKFFIDKLGYFDERLLGFGEEDGDICYRLLKNNMTIENLNVVGLINLIDNSRQEHVKKGIGKYSKFNRDYIYGYKYSIDHNSAYKGMFDTPMKQNISDINCYPMEKFFHHYKKDL